ncbi:MAG: acyl CoA:acetate/3-ketoacid CoA transferase, partial [Amphritea sp.]|nr:acyl CoA:acetate/3-ketoacid CoA transferase [Amphritea sp.]
QMDFKPLIDDNLTPMDPRLFKEGPMNLQHSGSHPAGHMRKVWAQLIHSLNEQRDSLEGCIAS